MELKLVPLRRRYLEFVREVRNDPRVSEYLFTDVYISKEGQERWYRKQTRDKKSLVFVALADGPIGYCQVKNIDHANYSCELGFCLAPEHQGKGYGARLVKELINYVTEKLNMHRLYVEVFADNQRAISLYERCGFAKEGMLRDKVLKRGDFKDVIIMGLITRKGN